MGFQPARKIHRVAPDVVEEPARPDHTDDHGVGVDADADVEVNLGGRIDLVERGEHGQRELGVRLGVVGPRFR
jgi:hypothetical protein